MRNFEMTNITSNHNIFDIWERHQFLRCIRSRNNSVVMINAVILAFVSFKTFTGRPFWKECSRTEKFVHHKILFEIALE